MPARTLTPGANLFAVARNTKPFGQRKEYNDPDLGRARYCRFRCGDIPQGLSGGFRKVLPFSFGRRARDSEHDLRGTTTWGS